METYLIYIGKAALAAGAFYLVFLALFQNQKQFNFNRIYLPVSLALSFAIPLITFTTVNYVEPVTVESIPLPVFTETFEPVVRQQSQPQVIWEWYHYLFAIYTAGTALFLFRLLLGHGEAWNIIRKSRVQELFDSLVNISKKDIHPFSFFSKIVLSEKTLSSPHLKIIVEHEKIHVKEKHTLDILFTEILFLLQWFNPFAWLLKDAVKNNLEYKTDHEIAKTNNAQTYQLAMLALADKQGVAPFLTALNGSQLRNRIIMMKKETENKNAWLKQMVILPLLAVLVMGLAEREVKIEFNQKQEQIENHNKYDFSKMKIVVDGEKIPTNLPEFKGIKLTKENNYNARIVIDIIEALNINIDDIHTYSLLDISENLYLYIRTKQYVPGNNKEFDEKIEPAKIRAKVLEHISNNKFVVKGKITDEMGNPIHGVEVSVRNKPFVTTTDKNGIYEIDLIGNNEILVFQKEGYKKYETEINPDVVEIDLELKKNKVINGKVTNENGEPIVGVIIQIEGTEIRTTTDSDGTFKLDNEKMPVTIIISKENYDTFYITLEEVYNFNIILTQDGITQRFKCTSNVTPKLLTKNSSKINNVSEFYNTIINEPLVYTQAEEMPQFPGGALAMRKFMINMMNYPESAKSNGVEGWVYVTLIIDKIGNVTNAKITKGLEEALDKEALRLVNSLPRWKPGRQDGKPVNVQVTIPVKFDLDVLENNEQNIIRGKVTNEKGEPVPGVLILIEETLNNDAYGVTTNNNGEYIFRKDVEGKTLIFKAPGYLKKEVKVGQNKNLDVRLKTDQNYEPKENMNKSRLPDKVNGVQLKNHSDPAKKPLYIIDGMESESMDAIEPKNIVSVTVLKEESATYLYGEKGKNGVIIITTKQGAAEKIIITELQLRQFIAENIKYPVEAQRAGLHGIVTMVIEPGKSNRIVSGQNYSLKDTYNLSEVVVTAHASDDASVTGTEKNSPILLKEVERVLQMLPEIDIPTIDNKLIRINIEFKLQPGK